MKLILQTRREESVAAGDSTGILKIEPKRPAILVAILPAALSSLWEPSIVSVWMEKDPEDLTEGEPAPGPVFVSARGPVPFLEPIPLGPNDSIDCTVTNDGATEATVSLTAYLLHLTPGEFARYEVDEGYRAAIRAYVAQLFR